MQTGTTGVPALAGMSSSLSHHHQSHRTMAHVTNYRQESAQDQVRMISMNGPVLCDLCGQAVPPHAHYVVRIDVFADPSMPPMTSESLEEMDAKATIDALMEEMKSMTDAELQDQVYRRFEYKICRLCQRKFLANPLGKPRQRKIAEN